MPCGVLGGSSQWFGYFAEFDGLLTVDSSESRYDTILAAYYNDCATCSAQEALATLIPLACNNDASPIIKTSQMSFAVTNGSIYSLVVDGVNGAAGIVKLNYKASPIPPNLASLRPTADGRVRFRVTGGVGLTVRVESSLDLRNFTPVLTTPLPAGGLDFVDTQPLTTGRYFRAIIP